MGSVPTIDTSGTWSHQNLGNAVINDIAYGDSTYIAVGNSGVVFSSRNGTTWTACSSGTTKNLTKVIFTNGPGTPEKLSKRSFAGGAFIAVGAGGTIITAGLATSIHDNWRIGRSHAGLARGGHNVRPHAYLLNGSELKPLSKSPATYRPSTVFLKERSGNAPSGIVVWH